MIEMSKLLVLGAALSLVAGAAGCAVEGEAAEEPETVGAQVLGTAGGAQALALADFTAKSDKAGNEGANEGANEGTLGPAPGITYFQVYAVGSSNIGWEYTGASQTSTVYNHGGAQLRVAVLQCGYGVANGSLSGTSGTRYLTQNLCGSCSSLHNCVAGETISAFLYYFSFDGMSGGAFSAYSNSLGIPYGVATDGINIL